MTLKVHIARYLSANASLTVSHLVTWCGYFLEETGNRYCMPVHGELYLRELSRAGNYSWQGPFEVLVAPWPVSRGLRRI